MHINTFWKIVIKSIGVWFLVNCIWIVPEFTSTLIWMGTKINSDDLLFTSSIFLITLVVYVLIIRLFLFKTEWLIKRLRLDQNFPEEKLGFEISAETILAITIAIIGGVCFLKCFPNLISSIFRFMNQKELMKNYPLASDLIYYLISTIIGFLVMTNGKTIAKYIWKKSAKNLVD